MQIVINISYGHYLTIKDGFLNECIKSTTEAIVKGTILPKGHGRLIDEERVSLSGIHFETELDHAMMIGRLNSAPTIIEADNEVEK